MERRLHVLLPALADISLFPASHLDPGYAHFLHTGWMKWKPPLGVRRIVGRRNAREQTRVQGAVVLREPGSPLPHESDDESGLRESQHPAPSHTAV